MPILQRQEIQGHNLTALKGSNIPRIWLFLDTETEEMVKEGVTYHHFHVGWTCLWKRKTETLPERESWTWFLSSGGINGYIQEMALRHKRINVVGHNIFFDLQAAGTFSFLTSQGWKLDFYYDSGLTYILSCKRDDVSMTFISTTNWFDQSLKSLGKVVGLKKFDIDFQTATAEQLKAYCYRDVEILVALLKYYIQFIQDNNFGSLALTKASQAFTAFRYRFIDKPIFIHEQTSVHVLERSGYIGGRTECFFIGHCKGGPFVTLDVNSMYPAVMKKFKYPVKLLREVDNPTIKFISEVLPCYGVIAEVAVNTPEPAYAVRHNHKTLFPVGRFTTTLCTEGMKYAMKRGHVKMVIHAAIYQMDDIFSGYVNCLYKLKRHYIHKKNPVMLLLTKYMLNSLYGKFAQLEIVNEKEDIGQSDEYSREIIFNLITGRNMIITRMMNTEITQRTEGEGKNSSCAIAAHITENGRFMLWDLINRVGRGRVLYCDTDSIKIRARDLKHLKQNLNNFILGGLKVENSSDQLYIEGSKNYRTEDKRRIKGIPESAKEVAPGVFAYRWFAGQVTHLKKNIKVGAMVTDMTRELKAKYEKGKVGKSGKVTPLRF